MAVAHNVPIGIARTLQFTARDTTDASLVTGKSTVKCIIVKQSSPVEYWNGSAFVTQDPGEQAMAQDSTVSGVYEDSYTLDDADVDYLVRCWDTVGANNVAEQHFRIRGVVAETADGVCSLTVTVKETDTNGDPVTDVTVSIRNASANEVSRDSTDSNGEAVALAVAGAATYTVVMSKAAWAFSDETLVVSSGDVATGSKAVEYYGTAFEAGSPSASYCRVYGWLHEVESGTAIQDQRIRVRIITQPYADAAGAYYDHENSHDAPDADGYWFIDTRQGATVRFFSVRISDGAPTDAVDKTVLIPESSSATLASIDAVTIS